VTPAVLVFALAAALPPPALEPPCAPCITWEVGPSRAAALARGDAGPGLHILLQETLQEPIAADVVGRLRGRGVAVLLGIGEASAAALPESEGVVIRLAASSALTPGERAFGLKSLATRLRAGDPRLRVGLEGSDAALAEALAGGLGAYVDFVVTGGARPSSFAGESWSRRRLASAEDVAPLLQHGGPVLAAWPEDAALADTPLALAALDALLQVTLAPLPHVAAACETDGAAPAPCAAPAFLGPDGSLLLLVTPQGPVRALRVPAPGTVQAGMAARVLSLTRPAPPAVAGVAVVGEAVRFALDASDAPFLLEVEGWGAQAGVFGSGVDVVAGRGLAVEEVLARHQAAAARQRRLAPASVATGTLVIAFQAPGLTAPLTITADVRIYSGPGGTEVEQRHLRLDGVSLEGDAVPRLPIVEPERVAVPPLTLVLGSAYRYALRGMERVGARECYRVAFDTPPGIRPGLRGQAWIEAAGFSLVRLQAVQTGLRGPIVSSEQTDEFAPREVAGATLWLLSRSTVHQAYEGPAFRTAIDRVLEVREQEVDPPDFARRLAAAHASPAVMLRETEHGYVYLKKAAPAPSAAAGDAGTRVPAGKATAVRTLALGLLVDPNIGDPLPFAGGGYSDFDFLHTGTQLNAFLAGAFAQLSWQAPALFGSRWRLQMAGQASLVEYNDRVFRRGVEQYGENLRQRPARMALEVSRPLGARWRGRAGYELEYTRLRGSDLTTAVFALPDSHLAHGLRLALDGQQGPWSASLWWRAARRQHWRAWGLPGDAEGALPRGSYQRYGATLARTVIASPRLLGRLELDALVGQGLDRFSRYSFDGFENRLVGYPVASVRFDRGLVGHGLVSWRARPGLRLQALLDVARVRDAGFEQGGRTLVGLGAGVEAALPWRTLLAVDGGYGRDGLDRDGRRGTQTLRLTVFRVF